MAPESIYRKPNIFATSLAVVLFPHAEYRERVVDAIGAADSHAAGRPGDSQITIDLLQRTSERDGAVRRQ